MRLFQVYNITNTHFIAYKNESDVYYSSTQQLNESAFRNIGYDETFSVTTCYRPTSLRVEKKTYHRVFVF